MATTAAARKHVEEIRRTKFSIGGEPNPLTEDLHQAVKNLSAELYAKDVHFLMELIQNAEDNEYPEGVDPSLEFVSTSKDITNTGAQATLLVFNNEKGFSPKNIDSICSVGRSTKKGLRKRGYIGEKGIGFKSVFLITSQPYIFSNGYRIKFNEKPCQHCNVGYIVPEWVEDDQILSAVQRLYGSATALPTTTLVLPLKSDKIQPVKDQLSRVHPEVLLFLSKIRKFSVREVDDDPTHNTVSAISISSEKNFATSKSMDADSYLIYLSADGINCNINDSECGYHMWKQRFRVKEENKVDVRRDIEEWVITLAFPIGERLKRGASSPGIYSFLPTETVTNFPFIIQSDFLLASSRESILWENKWNQGILDCVPVAFVNAFTTLVKSTEGAPVSSLPNMFRFLPVKSSYYLILDRVQYAIKEKLMNETIIPCESYTGQKLFRKPNEVGGLVAEFWSILNKARSEGVSFANISSHGVYLLHSSFDKAEYDDILKFLDIDFVDQEWYAKCIAGTDLAMGVSEDLYLELLLFIATEWDGLYYQTDIETIPIIKYVRLDGRVDLFTIDELSKDSRTVRLLSAGTDYISWLISWNTEFQGSTNQFFLPVLTQKAIRSCPNKEILEKWLKDDVKVEFVNVYDYAKNLSSSIKSDRKLAVTYCHFVYNSVKKKYLQKHEAENLCKDMPVVDNYGRVTTERSGVLVPAYGSKWVELIGSNVWRKYNYVELGNDYTRRVSYLGIVTSSKELFSFLQSYVKASDLPNLPPPDAAIPTLSSPLTKRNTFLLLNWLCQLRNKGVSLPEKFLSSIRNESWLKISISDRPGYRPPSESFMLESSAGQLFQNRSVLVDIPLVDQKFYGDEINRFKEDLKTIGVRFENKNACEFIGERLMSIAASSKLTRENVVSVLKFIRYLGENCIPSKDFINSIKEGNWLRTSQGDKAPSSTVLFSEDWNAASQISNIPFIDQDYYGKEVFSYEEELGLLGVVVAFTASGCRIVLDNLKPPSSLACLSAEAIFLILRCIRNLESSDKVAQALRNVKCLKTNLGFKCPSECFLLKPDSKWACLLQVFESFPVLDEKFYGLSIFIYLKELKKIGVMVELDDASVEFIRTFKQHASSFSIKQENVFSFLECYRKLKKLKVEFSKELKNCIKQEKWLKTTLGDYRSPKDCILYGNDFEAISPISHLPFVDDSAGFYGSEIHCYRAELKQFGVITNFKDGAQLVVDKLFLPQDSSSLTRENVCALLEAVRKLKEKKAEIPSSFMEKLSRRKWIKTQFGYRCPDECLLYSSDWSSILKRSDGPFIDEKFYGAGIRSFKDELNVLGVISEVKNGCQLVDSCLKLHSNLETIGRIYNYLCENEWKPVDEDDQRIWIPEGHNYGEWVTPKECVLHDNSDLFADQFYVLEKLKYGKITLGFFADVFNVKAHPSVEDYCNLWKKWESSKPKITHTECCAFWEFVAKSWNPKTEETFIEIFSKLPVLDSTSDEILLLDKRDVFIGDDLFLMDLFRNSSRPIFVWYPQTTQKSLTRTKLVDIYKKLGVRTLSESAQKNISDVDHIDFKPVNLEKQVIKRGLIKLILGFLADPRFKLDTERRHEAVSRLLTIEAYETPERMTVKYSLSFSSGNVVNVEANRMIRWDRQNSKFFTQKMKRSRAQRNVIEYASHFAEVIADGVLWENEELVPHLSELIRLGFLVEFDEEAVEFLMKSKNLEILVEDRDFISSIFSSDTSPADRLGSASKRRRK